MPTCARTLLALPSRGRVRMVSSLRFVVFVLSRHPGAGWDRVLAFGFSSQSFRSQASDSLFFEPPLRRRSGANSEAGREAAEGRMPGVKKSKQKKGDPSNALRCAKFPALLGRGGPSRQCVHALTLSDCDPSQSPFGLHRRSLRCSVHWRGPKIKTKRIRSKSAQLLLCS
jgi:hypothetical protein